MAAGSGLGVAVAGASGRMGRLLVDAVRASVDCRLAGTIEIDTADLRAALVGADVLIDFTRPDGTLVLLSACRALNIAAVVGTTGFTPQQRAAIGAQAQALPIVLAPNMSVGVNAMLQLVAHAARLLQPGWDVEVVESHHRHKVDAPSGTAIALGEAAARALGTTLDASAVWARHGHTGERPAGAIGFSAIRGGDIVGDHTVLFAGSGERIEITHRSTSRIGYADGALRAARWVAGRAPGLYDMSDVLGLPA